MPSQGQGATDFPAPLTCTGTFEGSQLSGEPGTIFYRFTYGTTWTREVGGDTCAAGGGEGQMEVSLRTADNRAITLSGPYQWEFAGAVPFHARGTLGGASFDLFGETRPAPDALDQDCVTKPFSRFIDTVEIVIRG